MPILNSKSDPLLKRLDLTRQLQTGLPNAQQAGSTFLGDISASAFTADWNEVKAGNFASGSQLQAGSIMSNVGAAFNTQLYNGMLDILRTEDPAAAVIELIREFATGIIEDVLQKFMEIISDALEEAFSAVFDAIGSIPVIGWVMDIAWEISGMIISIIEAVQAKRRAGKPEQIFEVAIFDPATDLRIANKKIMDLVRRSKDWTNIFMPPNLTDPNEVMHSRFGSKKLEGDLGRRIYAYGEHENWVGFIPGTAGYIDRGFEINPSKYRTTPFIRPLGTLLPTARDMASICWSQVNGSNRAKDPAPSMFAVDADKAIEAWQQYLFDFRMFLRGDSKHSHLSKDIRRRFVNDPNIKKLYGWAPWETSFDSKKGFDNFGINKSTPIKALKLLKKRQYAFLNRTVVAYVGPNYAGLGGYHSKMRRRWDDNRKRLLSHIARCDVDLTSIPDISYKLAMETAKEKCIPRHIGTLTAYPPGLVPGAKEPPPPGSGVSTVDVKRVKLKVADEITKHKRSRGKKGNLALIGLGAAVIFLAAKKGK